MNHQQLKNEISKILVKWDMPTRQAAIAEILALYIVEREAELKEVANEIQSIDWKFPERESDEYDWGYREALGDITRLVRRRINGDNAK